MNSNHFFVLGRRGCGRRPEYLWFIGCVLMLGWSFMIIGNMKPSFVVGEDMVAINAHGDVELSSSSLPQLTLESMNQHLIHMEYAVRGQILLRALELENQLKNSPGSLPFNRIIKCNIGNPQSLGQKPITFTRQVLSITMNPELLDMPGVSFPSDVVERAKKYLSSVPGSIGAYTESQGIDAVRAEVADFIERRDGSELGKVDVENIFLTEGASYAAEMLMKVLIRSDDDSILVPIPQYPLYSALARLMNGHFQGFDMQEEGEWDISMETLEKAIKHARLLGKNPRALVIINPGNPTGSTLPESSMIAILDFCARERLVLLADEVYQDNVYRPDITPFKSFRSVYLRTIQNQPLKRNMYKNIQIASFHSISKGMSGECGLRGGYFELNGFDTMVKGQLYKLASVKLCSNVPGQLAVGLMTNPPRRGDPSFELYSKEVSGIFESLKRRANMLYEALNKLPGMKCNPILGAMYAFPEITLPPKFIELAKKESKKPDVLYALNLLESTGIVVVPGSGFGQRNGTYHFRTTFLPPEDVMKEVVERFGQFQNEFMKQYA